MQEGIDSSLHKLFKLFVFWEFWKHCQRPNAKNLGDLGWFCNKGWVESCDLVKALKSVKFLLKRVKVLLKRVKKCKVFTKAR